MASSTALCNASASGKIPDILYLLQNGAQVNGLNEFNRTAIQVVMLGSIKSIEILLNAGANPNVRDPSCGLTVTHDAAREGFLDSVSILIKGGADVNIADNKGNLPLHLAAGEGHLEVAKLLIGFTEKPKKTNNEGVTAEQLARDHGKTVVAAFIQNYQK
ncbi:cyclin-dependent kinase 4 inhibitor C [Archocentrus centrarchus]|uniref:cyclin-dependent kinase 4 inhibitor C n=1 Tax=Archocentrus centrarchus TaxID=63155 RepID=UPI0011E9E8F1|nr:cyclin-dependent kinase 4 inhibitor C [Archocentrus centrarchus]